MAHKQVSGGRTAPRGRHSSPESSLGRGTPALRVLVLLVGALLGGPIACGGGGGGEPEPPILLELGEFSATTPSRVTRTFLNPLSAPASVTAVTLAGPFGIDPEDLPGAAAALSGLSLPILFTPGGPGEAQGQIILRWSGGGAVVDQVFDVRARGEEIVWSVTPTPLDFGDVLPGETRDLQVEITNGSQRSPVTFTSATTPSTTISLAADPFPLTVAPGATVPLTVRYAPTAISGDGGILRLGRDDVGGPVDVTVWANSTGTGERVVDFGTQTLSGSTTPELSVEVPDTCVSITFEGVMTDAAQVGVFSITGPDGRSYVTGGDTNNVQWVAAPKSFAVHLPNSDEAVTQLVPGGGTYTFRMMRAGGLGTTMDVRVILEMRANKLLNNSVLPLNIFLANGITPTQATAANDANFQSMLTQLGQILGAQGITLGDIDYYDILSPTFDNIAQGEETQLFQVGGSATRLRLNLFFVKQVWAGQLLGISGSIDGPKRQGDQGTGVCCLYFDAQPGAIAAVAAHEVCHYLGLWHTVEVTGAWDRINDTPNCPPTGTNASCSVEGGDLLMHWQANGGRVLSNGQGGVLRGHALMQPPGQGGTSLQRKRDLGPWTPDQKTLDWLAAHAGAICGTQR